MISPQRLQDTVTLPGEGHCKMVGPRLRQCASVREVVVLVGGQRRRVLLAQGGRGGEQGLSLRQGAGVRGVVVLAGAFARGRGGGLGTVGVAGAFAWENAAGRKTVQ